MLDSAIKTFLTAAKAGSFNRAAEAMYLSPNAVKKRITQLETQLGLSLFQRTAQGLRLTEAGQSLYADFSRLDLQLEQAVRKAREIQQADIRLLRIGISTAFSDFLLTERWYEIRRLYRQVSLVFFGSQPADLEQLLQSVGKSVDLAVEIYDPQAAERFSLGVQPISRCRFCVGIPSGEPALPAGDLPLPRLAGKTLCLLGRGRARCFDEIRDQLLAECPDIQLEDLAEYSVRTVSACLAQGRYALVLENMTQLFPFYSFAPLHSACRAAFGIYFAADAGKKEREFICQVQTVADEADPLR